MLRNLFLFMLVLHGAIHVLGFLKAFRLGAVAQLSKDISKPMGCLWLLATVLFVLVAIFMLLKKEWWWIPGLIAVLLSQILLFSSWGDARFGSIPNAIVLIVALLAGTAWWFEQGYRSDVKTLLLKNEAPSEELLTEKYLEHLPAPVQRYLRYVGVVNQPKVKNVHIVFKGQMREKGKNWFPFRSEQYNGFEQYTRLFFMKAKMFGLTVPGYHAYQNKSAAMRIKLFGLFPIVSIEGQELFKAETVTIFNDMCLLAPATLIDSRISWEAIDDTSSRATFTNEGQSIQATLYFNATGQLVNFVSDDRYAASDMKRYRFSTPVTDYKNFHGFNVMSYGETVWHYPDGEFVYGKFELQEIVYNVGPF